MIFKAFSIGIKMILFFENFFVAMATSYVISRDQDSKNYLVPLIIRISRTNVKVF